MNLLFEQGWLGLSPKTQAEKLEDNRLVTATNCDLRGGVLAPIGNPGTLSTLNNGTLFLGNIPLSEQITIDKPGIVQRTTTFERLCKNVASWLDLYVYSFVRSDDGINPTTTILSNNGMQLTLNAVHYTDQGIDLSYSFNDTPNSAFCAENKTCDIIGPIYRLKASASAANGGPEVTSYMPFNWRPDDSPSADSPLYEMWGDTPIPQGAIELKRFDKVYGYITVLDIKGPQWGREGLSFTANQNVPLPTSDVVVRINLNYQGENKALRYFYFKQTKMNGLREGPLSDISERVEVRPGEILKLQNLTSGNRIYQSVPNGRFLRLDTATATTYEYQNTGLKDGSEAPDALNYNDAAFGSQTQSTFFQFAALHPGGFGITIVNFTDSDGVARHLVLRSDRSSTGVPRVHAWKKQFSTPLAATLVAGVMLGDTYYVFDTTGENKGEVHAFSGSGPQNMGYSTVSSTHPLLNKLGLCKFGTRLFYPSTDGLIELSGGAPRNVTIADFTAEQWLALGPANMKAWTGNNAIYLDGGTSNSKLRIDLASGDRPQITRWTGSIDANGVASFGGTLIAGTKTFQIERKTIFDRIRVVATGEVTVRHYLNGASSPQVTQTITNDGFTAITEADNVYWNSLRMEFETTATIKRVTLFERQPIQMDGRLSISGDALQQLVQEDLWITFQGSKDRLAAGRILSLPSSPTLTLKTNDPLSGWTALSPTYSITSAAPFRFSRVASENPYSDKVRLGISPITRLDAIDLYCVRSKPLGDSLRVTHSPGEMPEWWHTRYELIDKRPVAVIMVNAAVSSLTMRVYYDDSETATTYTVTSGTKYVIAAPVVCSSLMFDFDTQDDQVREVVMLPLMAENIPPDGVVIIGPDAAGAWMGKFPDRGRFGVMDITARSYTSGSTIKIYRDGNEVLSKTFAQIGRNQYRLPFTMGEGAIWTVITNSSEVIDRIRLMPVRRASAENLQFLADDTGFSPWLYHIWDIPNSETFTSGLVRSETYSQTLRLFKDTNQTDTPDALPNVPDDAEFLIDNFEEINAFRFDFNGSDHLVNEALFAVREPIPVGVAGIKLRGTEKKWNWLKKYLRFKVEGTFTVLRVVATDYTGMVVTLEINGRTYTYSPTSAAEIKLPRNLPVFRECILSITHKDKIDEVFLIGKVVEDVRGGAVKFRRNRDPFSWLANHFKSDRLWRPSCVRIIADKYPVTLRYWTPAMTDEIVEESFSDSSGHWLAVRITPSLTGELDIVVPDGTTVEEVAMASSMEALR